MSDKRSFHVALWTLVGVLLTSFAVIAIMSGLQPQLETRTLRTTNGPTVSPNLLQECINQCGDVWLECQQRAESAFTSCQNQIFEDGLGSCYGPDGDLRDCDELEEECKNAKEETERACLRARNDCIRNCHLYNI